ncbi:hypothetical protein ABPG75_013661 [Micractinium tetrahymenae]
MEPVFQLDEAASPAPSAGPDAAVAASSGTPGSATPAPAASTPGSATPPAHGEHMENEDIAVERRVVPLLECSEDTCSICLEDYTKEDPGAPTVCGHHFHLQCIMQWAQRSRECPLCFKSLQLEDEEMNSLLPFGEYVSPAQRAAEQASLETWELERLLIRVAAASQREQRHHRSSRHGGSSSRHRRQGSRGEASAPQPIRGSGGASVAPEAVAAAWWSLPPDAAAGPGAPSSSSAAAAAAVAGSSGRELRPGSASSGAHPASWPPAGSLEASSGGGGAAGDEGHVVSPRSRSGALSIKGRLASLRLKDKLDKTARDLKSLFSPGSGSGSGPRGGGPGAAGVHR